MPRLTSSALAILIATTYTPLICGDAFSGFSPGNLIVSRTSYAGTASTVTIGQPLPPICPATAACGNGKATDNGSFPTAGSTNNVWNNNLVDGSFGVTSPIYLDQVTTSGVLVNTLAVPPELAVTSFSSKSELALNVSQDGQSLTFMGYAAPVNALDVSNSNTPVVYDPTNPAGGSYYRVVAQMAPDGTIQTTLVNAYSGNNGRAAILANGSYYMVGNSNNGSGTPAGVVASAGVQIASPGESPALAPLEIGNFSIAQIIDPTTGQAYPPDKLGKDNNFRGLTIFDNTLYVSKGSGGNGINTVYQVGQPGILPAESTASATPIAILPGFPVTLAKNATFFPFGFWFADAQTLYVADEGDGTLANAGHSATAGLQKWVLGNGTWQLAYVLQNGLALGETYTLPGYPDAIAPATDGLRNITGRVNTDGTATIYGVTSTVSHNGDQGADPNRLVAITDVIANTDSQAAQTEQFRIIRSAGYGEVLRGVSFAPVNAAPLDISSSGLLYSRVTRTFSATITVTNSTGAAISGPLMLVLTKLAPGVAVAGAHTVAFGAPAISIGGTGGLAPGQSVTVPVAFTNAGSFPINFTAEVFPEF